MNQEPWICDERVGCVAVYRGPKRNCLDGISESGECVFFRLGQRTLGGSWSVDERDLQMGRKIAEILNERDEARAAARWLLSRVTWQTTLDEAPRRYPWLAESGTRDGEEASYE